MEVSVEKVSDDGEKYFCAKSFRKEIKSKNSLKSLKTFIRYARESDSVIFQYFDQKGSILEILSLIDSTATGDLTTAVSVFDAVHLILLRFQLSDPKYHQLFEEGAKCILHSHVPIIQSLLSMNTSKHKKVALKLLTSIVTLHSNFANEVLNCLTLSPTLVNNLIQPELEKESVRKCFILFVISFLMEGSSSVMRNLLENKGFLNNIIPGLKFDEVEIVNMTLSLMENKILKNSAVPKMTKLKVFNTQVVKHLFDLYDWKGVQGIKEQNVKKKKIKLMEANADEKILVTESVHSFLLLLCTSKKYGVIFSDMSLGMVETSNNQLLLSVFESLSNPLQNKKMSEVVLKALIMSPDLVKPTLNKLEPYFQPRNSKNWFEAMSFAEALVTELNVNSMLKNFGKTLSENQIFKIVTTFCIPNVFLKVAQCGANNFQPVDIRLSSLKLFSVMWEGSGKIINSFHDMKIQLRKSLNELISKFLPHTEEIVQLWYCLCNENFLYEHSCSREKRLSFILVLIKIVEIIVECQRDGTISSVALTENLLFHLNQLKNSVSEQDFNNIQVKIVQILEADLKLLTPEMDLFTDSVLILLRFPDDHSLLFASKILLNLEFLKKNEAEVYLWLLRFSALPSEHHTYVSEALIDSLKYCYNHLDEQFLDNSCDIDCSKFCEKSATPFLFFCLKILKMYTNDSDSNRKKISYFRYYLGDILIHLQHLYPHTSSLLEKVKPYKKLIEKNILNYLEIWMNESSTMLNIEEVFHGEEKAIAKWLVSATDGSELLELCNDKSSSSRLFGTFTMVFGYFVMKVIKKNFSEFDVKKFSNSLSHIFKLCSSFSEGEEKNFTSRNSTNFSYFYRKCYESFFSNPVLLKSFNIFKSKKNGISECSSIITNVLIKNDYLKKILEDDNLMVPWKVQFLRQLEKVLKKKKSIESVENLEVILNIFDYDSAEVTRIINHLVKEDSLDIFVFEKNLSKWGLIFTKFIQMDVANEKTVEAVVQKLCLIIKNFCDRDIQLDLFEICLAFVIKNHPRQIPLIENDYLEFLLRRERSNDSSIAVGQLLLQDPVKAKHFLTIADKFLNSYNVLPLTSVLLVSDDSFLETLTSGPQCFYFKISNISQENNPEFFELLKCIYEKHQQSIFRVMAGAKEEIILKNLKIIKLIINLFCDKKILKKFYSEIESGVFQPTLVFEALRKSNSKKLAQAFLKGLIKMFVQTVENSMDFENDFWLECNSIIEEFIKLNLDVQAETILNSPDWKRFFKLALGLCLSTKKHPFLCKIIYVLTEALHPIQKEQDFGDCSVKFQMLISHSQFLNVMLSHSELKNEVVKLFYTLIQRAPTEMSKKHIPILLAAYSATMCNSDQTILKTIKFYESKGFKVNDFEPVVWGETAVSRYSIGTNAGLSLWQKFNMISVLDLLDAQKMEISLKDFPINKGLEEMSVNGMTDPTQMYDPGFLLPLFINLLSPGSVVFPLPFIYKGGLAYTVRALSSESKDVRVSASIVLGRFYNHLELSQNSRQKVVWMHFINCFRFGIQDVSAKPVPNISSLFLAKMTFELTSYSTEMSLPLQNFLLAKSYFSFASVPEFLPLFHSAEMFHWKHRDWLLEIMRDGTLTDQDVEIVFHSMAFKVIFCFFHSNLCNGKTKNLILQFLDKVMKTKNSKLLISEYGLLDWVKSIEISSNILQNLLQFLLTTCTRIINDIKFSNFNSFHLSEIIQVLKIAIQLLPAINVLKDESNFEIFLNIICNCFSVCLHKEKNYWFNTNKEKLKEIIEAGINILGFDCSNLVGVPFYFREYKTSCKNQVTETLQKSIFLFNLLITVE